MNQTNKTVDQLEAIQLQFMEQWEAGETPTLQDYVTRHPEWARELTDFVLLFIEVESAAAAVTEAEVEGVGKQALERVRAGAMAPAGSLREARTALGWSPGRLAQEVSREARLSNWAVLQFERGMVQDWTSRVAKAFAWALGRTLAEIAQLLQGSAPAAASGHYSAKGAPGTNPQTIRTFAEVLDECVRRGEMTDAERRYWLEDEGE